MEKLSLTSTVTSCLFKIAALNLFPTVLSALLSANDGLEAENYMRDT